MLKFVVLSTLLAVTLAIPKPGRYWEADCGESKYPNAGIPQDKFIVGGQEARENEFPFQVTLLYFGSFFCGGSVITANTVMTAAHCTSGDQPNQLSVVVGNHDRRGTDAFEVTVAVTSNTVHEDYDKTGNIENDIALLGLAEILTFNDGVQPVCPPAADQAANVGEMTVISGWGATASGGSVTNILYFAHDIPVMDRDACENCFLNRGWVDETMVCAGNCGGNEKDSCQGDSGGPMVIKNSEGLFEIVGITSWGLGCAGATPGVYADVYYMLEWIDQNIN